MDHASQCALHAGSTWETGKVIEGLQQQDEIASCMGMNTIFLTSFHPLISRNILSTKFMDLVGRENRVVLFVPDFKRDYFEKEFSGRNFAVEGVPVTLTGRDLFMRKFALVLCPTQDLVIKRRAQFYKDRNIFSFIGFRSAQLFFGGSLLALRIMRFLDAVLPSSHTFAGFFETLNPDAVFSTDVQNELDVRLLHEARARRVTTVGMVRSWDNLTSKGVLRVVPDRLVVHNETIKEEAVRYNLVPPANIFVIGIPHYDNYMSPPERSKEAFFKAFDLDPRKKLVVYAPIGDRYIRDNETDTFILTILSKLDLNILVRLPPTDSVRFDKFVSKGARVAFDTTGQRFLRGGKKVHEVGREDDERLKEALSFCDAVVTGQSTVSIDAAAFDKPVVVAAFDHEPRAYWDSVTRYYDYEYYRKFRERSGIAMAYSPEELLVSVTRYLKDPHLDKAVRERIVRDQVFLFDGKATERLAGLVIESRGIKSLSHEAFRH